MKRYSPIVIGGDVDPFPEMQEDPEGKWVPFSTLAEFATSDPETVRVLLSRIERYEFALREIRDLKVNFGDRELLNSVTAMDMKNIARDALGDEP